MFGEANVNVKKRTFQGNAKTENIYQFLNFSWELVVFCEKHVVFLVNLILLNAALYHCISAFDPCFKMF